MKRTDLAKLKLLKINSKMNQTATPARFGKEADIAADRREQRKLDQAQGLVPFAVKLNHDLVKQVQALAQERQVGLNDMAAELLKKGLQN